MRNYRWLLWVVMVWVTPVSVQAEDAGEWVAREMEGLVGLYREFHARPELSLQEEWTSQKLAGAWREAGAEVTEGVGGYGVVGLLRNGEGPTVMLRTDMDALPLEEKTGLPFASKVRVKTATGEVGVMHACGHDVHMTNLVAVARYLNENRNLWGGTVMLIGQPAEERVMGARMMMDDGLYARFGKPIAALAMHVDPSKPTGSVGMRAGYALANVNSVDVTLFGRGGHGAQPHTTIDPVVQGAQLVMALQTIVSREVYPIEPAVVTVGSIHAGSKHNIISERCDLQLTMRSYSPAVRQQLIDAVKRKARGIAIAAGAPEPVVKVSEGTPAVYNDDGLVGRLRPVLERTLGAGNVGTPDPTMGAEDFGVFGEGKDGGRDVPVLMMRLGSISAERLTAMKAEGRSLSLHSPVYYPDIEA
ncbi:MAG: amidohydrolase, partial [Planctomycetota bacterium]